MDALKDDFIFRIWPGWPYLFTFAGTGALAGLSQAPIEYVFSRLAPERHSLHPKRLGHTLVPGAASSPPSHLAALRAFASGPAPVLVSRAALRFGAFGQFQRIRHVKRALGTNRWPRWLDTAASGGAAGLVEAVVANRIANPRSGFPHWTLLFRHPAKLFCCFGTYGYLSNRWAERRSRETEMAAGGGLGGKQSDKMLLPSGPPKPFWKAWVMGMTAGAVGSGIMGAVEGLRPGYLLTTIIPRGALGIGTLIAVQVTTCDMVLKHYEIV